MRSLSCAGVAIAIACSSGAWAQDEHAGHHHVESAPTNGEPIVVTINPEARVSAVWSGPIPPAGACGSTLRVPIAVHNQGYVTAPLQAQLVGLSPAGATVGIPRQPLSGIPVESRVLDVFLREPGPVDLTIEFSIPYERPDLGGRARIHFVLACNP